MYFKRNLTPTATGMSHEKCHPLRKWQRSHILRMVALISLEWAQPGLIFVMAELLINMHWKILVLRINEVQILIIT